MKSLDVVAVGSCYVDLNATNFPFDRAGIANETELVGGKYEIVAGGSAVNFCSLLGTLGMRPAFIGVAGTDSMGDLLESLLTKEAVESKLIRKSDVETNISFNMTSSDGSHIMCVAGTANAALSPNDVLPILREAADNSKAIYFGGCFKLKSFSDSFPSVVSIAKENSLSLFVDHGRVPNDVMPEMIAGVQNLVLGADYYLASRNEFTELWNVGGIDEGITLLYDKAPKLTVIVKDGANGAYYLEQAKVRHVLAHNVDNVLNLTGAGDSFNAGFMTAIFANQSIYDAVAYGCAVAAAKISGQAIPTKSFATYRSGK